MKPGRSSFQGLLTGLMMVGGCGPRGCPLGRIEHRTVHRTAAEERAKPRLPSFLPVEGTPWIRIRRL